MKNKNLLKYFIIIIISIMVGAFGLYYGIQKFDLFSNTVINKTEKKVTVIDKGIADAVEKLYDAVVVVGAYKNNVIISSGTGFVYKTKGTKSYILTNSHVVSGAEKVKVKFTDGNTYDVKIVGNDEYGDIAVLKIESDKIISESIIGKSAESRLGDTVFTIGAPLDTEYSWTVTRGIVSGKDRLIEVNAANSNSGALVMSVLQTDAAINSGNSGGPLANSNGEVIGITNMKLISGGVEGMGFAIPIEDAVHIADQLIENGKITRPVLGVGTLNVTDAQILELQYGIKLDKSITSGAVIGLVQDGTSASDAKLKKGDVIIKFGKYEITSSAKLKYYLYKYNIGDKVEVEFIRGTTKKSTTVKLTNEVN